MIEPGKKMRKKLQEGQFEEKIVEIEVSNEPSIGMQVFGPQVWKI